MGSSKKVILNSIQLKLTIDRLSCEIIENHVKNLEKTVIIGLQPRGVQLAYKIHNILELNTKCDIKHGYLDSTFFRDDFRRRESILVPKATSLNFSIEGLNVVLVDDVLFTGRSIRSALDSLGTFGRPNNVELLVLIDRRFSRELPIQPKYVGKSIDVIDDEHVLVNFDNTNLIGSNSSENNVILLSKKI